jgi:hypothetical protein
MAEFCKCGSLKIKGSCTNKKCEEHIASISPATFKQVDFIKDLTLQLGEPDDYDFINMTTKEASKIIEELQTKVEIGGAVYE